ncbi:diguanylate cyclase domain-containing protein [Massilia aerilata]|uniref:Diguanylate cyclase domain-containing protein n=1 Tax=Massilia aerilata TaxID=453817 RepID=A0ABW0RWN2_9BURK
MQSIVRLGSLKFRITVVVAVSALLAASLVALASLAVTEQEMMHIVGDQQYTLLESVASNIDEDLESKRTMLKILAEALEAALIHDGAQLQEFLEKRGTLRDEFFNVVAFDPNGTVIASLADRRAIGTKGFQHREYFTRTVMAREGTTSEPFRSALSGKPVVLVTQPVYADDGRLLFILGGGINLESPRFFGQLLKLKPGDSGYLFSVTTKGVIIHHPTPGRILANVKSEPGGAVKSTLAAMSGFEGWTEGVSKSGVHALISYKRLRSVDWIVGAVYPVSEALTPIIDMRRKALIASFVIAIATAVIAWFAVLRLLRPLAALRRHVAGLSDGETDISVFDVDRKDEFGDLSRAFYNLSQERAKAEAELAELAQTDALTGVYNRRMLEKTLAFAVARTKRASYKIVLAYMDIDHFKAINDGLGHACGDAILVEFAQRLLSVVRTADTVARLGGDEFVIVFEHVREVTEAQALGEKIVDVMRRPFNLPNKTLSITTSVGLAISDECKDTPELMLARADTALYKAKQAGRDRYVVSC